MKQTTIQFDKRKSEPVTMQRLQKVIDLVQEGEKLSHALQAVGLKGSTGKYLVQARILVRLNGRTVVVVKPKLEPKDFFRIMDIQTKDNLKRRKNHTTISYQVPKANTDMLGLVKLPKTKPVKKAVALPWYKRFLLYLLNH